MRATNGLTIALLAGVIIGCASKESASLPAARIVWPPAPETPRIAYVQSITRPADVGIRPTGAKRFMRWVMGASEEDTFSKPFGIALDEQDNLCVTDTGLNAVSFYDRTKKTWKRWNKIGALHFGSPVAVAKRGGKFYVADSALARVIVFGEDGKLLFQITNKLERPSGLAIANDRLFVADSKRHAIVSFDLDGKFISEFGKRGTGRGDFNFPTHVAIGPSGNLFITDSMNSRVQVVNRAGAFQSEIGSAGDRPGHFGRPKGVAVDSLGHVYVVDAMFDTVTLFDHDGKLLMNFGDSGSGAGNFWLANGVAISRANEIYVADAYNKRIQVFRYIGPQP